MSNKFRKYSIEVPSSIYILMHVYEDVFTCVLRIELMKVICIFTYHLKPSKVLVSGCMYGDSMINQNKLFLYHIK